MKTLTPEQAEVVRRERRAFTKARWAASDPDHVREKGLERWQVWVEQPQRGGARRVPCA